MTWHPATDPPSDGREVLGMLSNGTRIVCRFSCNGWHPPHDVEHIVRLGVTQWHELPPPPGEPDPTQALADALRMAIEHVATNTRSKPKNRAACLRQIQNALAACDAQKGKPPTP